MNTAMSSAALPPSVANGHSDVSGEANSHEQEFVSDMENLAVAFNALNQEHCEVLERLWMMEFESPYSPLV